QKLAHQSLRAVVQMGARIFAFILIVGIGIGFWAALNIPTFNQSTTLDQPLGLFFGTFVITLLCFIIPSHAGRAIGSFNENIWGKEGGATHISVTPTPATLISSP